MGIHGSILGSPVAAYVQEEFERVEQLKKEDVDQRGKSCKDGPKNKIYLKQIQQLKPPREFLLDLHHIATLWKLDADHDGCVTFQELMAFAEFCNEKRRLFGNLDFQSKLKAQCVVDLWEVIRDERGEDEFATWLCKLACQGERYATFDCSPNVDFMSTNAVDCIYDLMSPFQISSHIDKQGFVDMLQQIGENQGLNDLQAEELDDWVPLKVVHTWAKGFIVAYCNLFKELDLEPPKCTVVE